jgi:response regulator RpfG family c-di-GMP phosphodiesterase
MDLDRARAILQDGKGSQWDPAIIEALFRVLDERGPEVDEVSTGRWASDSAPADARAA